MDMTSFQSFLSGNVLSPKNLHVKPNERHRDAIKKHSEKPEKDILFVKIIVILRQRFTNDFQFAFGEIVIIQIAIVDCSFIVHILILLP